jgi:hypothetical protein
VIAFAMIVLDEFADRSPNVVFADRDDPLEALFLDHSMTTLGRAQRFNHWSSAARLVRRSPTVVPLALWLQDGLGLTQISKEENKELNAKFRSAKMRLLESRHAGAFPFG